MIELPSGVESADSGNGRQGVSPISPGSRRERPGRLGRRNARGAQLLGAWGSDALLLDAAEALERATDREFVELRPAALA
jgi:hypothetical protein